MQTIERQRIRHGLSRGRPRTDARHWCCVHGTLGDFRTWNAVLGPLSRKHRVIALSLRRFFPEHWDGVGNDYLMAQHVDDVIGFIEKLNAGPVDLMGHSRGGHIAISRGAGAAGSAAQAGAGRAGRRSRTHRCEPASPPPGPVPLGPRVPVAAEMVRNGDIDGALAALRRRRSTVKARGRGWPAAPRQQLRDNVHTLLGQVGENRKPFTQERSGIDQDTDAC